MLSIIICSINKELLNNLSRNIEETIGIPHEIIAIDNTIAKLSITQVYNKGVRMSKYEYLCFIHEDILFHTKNWGQILINLLKSDDIGLVGVSGTIFKSQAPVNWSVPPNSCFRSSAIIWYNGKAHNTNRNLLNEITSQVAVVDGLFLSCTREMAIKYPFDEKNLTGFHLYDMDLSVRIGKEHKVVVTHSIIVEHLSSGNRNITWYNDSVRWHRLNKNQLPITINLKKKHANRINYYHYSQAILYSIKFNQPLPFKLRLYWKLITLSFFRLNNLRLLKHIALSTFKKYSKDNT